MAAGESAAQLFSRLGSRQPLHSLGSKLFSDIPSGLTPGDVVELHGPEGSGKTEMLLHLIANCVLPETWNGVQLGGRGMKIIFIDTDFHFHILRLVAILECRIEDARKSSTSTSCEDTDNECCSKDIEEFIKKCLSRLYVLRCNSSLELLTSLISLEQMLIAKPEVCVIMIDSLSAFYWIDRSTGGESTNDQEQNMNKIISMIKKYARDLLLVVIVTTHSIFNTKSTEPYFCRGWSGVVKYKYLLSRNDNQATRHVFIAQRILPRSNQFKTFYCTEKGVEFNT